MCVGGGGGGEYSDIFIHTYLGFKILNFNTFVGFQRMNIFGYEAFVDIFGGHHIIGLYLGVISIHHIYINCWLQLYRWSVME